MFKKRKTSQKEINRIWKVMKEQGLDDNDFNKTINQPIWNDEE